MAQSVIRIGILTVRKEKIGFWKKVQTPIKNKEEFVTQAEIKVAEIAWTSEEILRLPRCFRRLIYQGGKRFLLRQQCSAFAPDKEAAQVFSVDGGTEDRGIVLPLSPKAMERCILSFRDSIKGKTVCLKVKSVATLDEKIVEVLCPWVGSLVICTEERAAAQILADRICNDYGFDPQIRDGSSMVSSGKVLVDMDVGLLKIQGEKSIDGIEIFLDLHGYRVNQGLFFQGLPILWEDSSLAFWTQGKKRLTRA